MRLPERKKLTSDMSFAEKVKYVHEAMRYQLANFWRSKPGILLVFLCVFGPILWQACLNGSGEEESTDVSSAETAATQSEEKSHHQARDDSKLPPIVVSEGIEAAQFEVSEATSVKSSLSSGRSSNSAQ